MEWTDPSVVFLSLLSSSSLSKSFLFGTGEVVYRVLAVIAALGVRSLDRDGPTSDIYWFYFF